MARKHGVITKYNPAIAYSSQSIQADMQESKEGRYVELQDYENALGVIRKLKTKLAKKERRSVKLKKPETGESTSLTLEEKKNVQVGEKYIIQGHWALYEPTEVTITRVYDKDAGDFGFDVNRPVNGWPYCVIGNSTVISDVFKMERVK